VPMRRGRKASNLAEVEQLEQQVATAGADIPLIRASNQTGYKGVRKNKSNDRPFQAFVSRGNKSLGNFKTVEAAALAYARHIKEKCNAPQTATLVECQTADFESAPEPAATVVANESIMELLRRPGSKTGFKGVSLVSGGSADMLNPYVAMVPLASWNRGADDERCRCGAAHQCPRYLGTLPTPKEAAAKIANYIERHQS